MTSRPAIVAWCALAAATLASQVPPPLRSGLDVAAFDRGVRPQDDLFRFANGAWLARTEIPLDRVAYGGFQEVGLKVEDDLHDIIGEIAARPDRWGAEGRQIADLYGSLMDEAGIEAAGLAPARRQLERIHAIASPADLAREAGVLSASGGGGPFDGEVGDDPQRPGARAVRIRQGGTLLPERRYYLGTDARYVEIRRAYERYLTTLFTLAGRPAAAADARALIAFETTLAAAQSTEAAPPDGRRQFAQLTREMPGFDWIAWARPQGIDRASVVVLAPPSFFTTFAATVAATPLETLKAWLTARYLTSVAPYISRSFGDARFEFFGRVLTGQQAPTERWRRGVGLVNGYLGDAIGRRYVERHFPTPSRQRVRALVETIVRAYREAIAASDWLSSSARAEAVRKLDRLTVKIGYPDVWRSYRGFDVRRGDLVGNVERGRRNEAAFRLSVDRAADSQRWPITPQTVNATYIPAANELVVPAAILQPPFFDPAAEDAVNYGAIGAIVGHEIGHALDARGRFFDARGRVREWWTAGDEEAFLGRAAILVDQFAGYEPVSGARVDGLRTLHENVNDLAGLSMAYAAYQLSLDGRPAPVIDGLTGDQRFFLAWARVWRSKERDDYLRQWVLTMPHAPSSYRVNGIVAHIPAFYRAFGVTSGDGLYRDSARRVRIW
jgi:endothelin-converting enzyme/putative endopeptidase